MGDEAFLMTYLLLILAIFMRRRRGFLERTRSISVGACRGRCMWHKLQWNYWHREIDEVLAEKLGNLTGPEKL